ncbi:hypothetical protein OKJ48_21235 [Streptomyces kunmingensis]|uniref:Uncharacterized protein n=1 Tax=Streptomyces kunmingensis TaxID=68225 RepID=A0ABU6CDG8_9ACTN|nr:hypothetical protein [Streptomyces kunmingensis]MEB3962752.1 hypothetical protein [Streptomyces kunmingensis]
MTTPPGRYHLSLTIDGAHVLDGWWDDPDTAEFKFGDMRKEHEANAGARLLLTEWDDGREWPLREWPAPPGREPAFEALGHG